MKYKSIKRIILLTFTISIFNCKTPEKRIKEISPINISVSDTYILVNDKSYLPKDFIKGYSKAHHKKLTEISPDTIYNVVINVSEETEMKKVLFIKNVLKKYKIKKVDIEIRDASSNDG